MREKIHIKFSFHIVKEILDDVMPNYLLKYLQLTNQVEVFPKITDVLELDVLSI